MAEPDGRNPGKHHFWTSQTNFYDPKAQFRFMVRIPGLGLEDARPEPGTAGFADQTDTSFGNIWWAKTIDKPGYSVVDLNKDKYYSQVAKAPPAVNSLAPNLKPVTMTLIDPVYPNTTRKLVRYLRRGGFQEQQAYEETFKFGGPGQSFIETNGFADATKTGAFNGFPRVEIDQLDARGKIIESWTLINAYPAEVDFGKLDYSSDGLVEITVTWGYQTFTCEFPEQGNEKAFGYFSGVGQTLVAPKGSKETLIEQWKKLTPGEQKTYGTLESYLTQFGVKQ